MKIGKAQKGDRLSGLEQFLYKCEKCGSLMQVTSEFVMNQLAELLAERDILKARLGSMSKGPNDTNK